MTEKRIKWSENQVLLVELALFYVSVLRRIVQGEKVSREKEMQDYARKHHGLKLRANQLRGLFHPDPTGGRFINFGLKAQVDYWISKPNGEALEELDAIERELLVTAKTLRTSEVPGAGVAHTRMQLQETKHREFPLFNQQDFAVFEKRKQSDRRYNKVRKEIWERMKLAQESIGLELDSRDIQLNCRLSRFYPNSYNKFRVSGIWLGYSDASSRYFEKPHLSFGIYRDYLFAGFVINEVAVEGLLRVASLVEHDPQWFLQVFGTLTSERRVVWYRGVEIEEDATPGQLSELCTEIRNEADWLSIGVVYGPDECPQCCEGLAEKVADVFEDLMPLYDFTWGETKKLVDHPSAETRDEWDEGEENNESDLIIEIRGGQSHRRRSHPRLSRLFRNWIRDNYTERIRKETKGIDVEFKLGTKTVCAELKTGSEGSTQYMIRSAIGQILEYNLYPKRTSADEWMIVLDTKPSKKDKLYIDKLRSFFPKPLYLCWLKEDTFMCYPTWPEL